MNLGKLATAVVVLSALIMLPTMTLLLVAFIETLFLPPVVVYTNLPFPVTEHVIAPGQSLTLTVGRCANDLLAPDPLIYTFTRELVDSDTDVRTGISDGASVMGHGCQDGSNAYQPALNLIPQSLPDGKYFVRGTTTARGRFKTTVAEWYSEPFEVRRNR